MFFRVILQHESKHEINSSIFSCHWSIFRKIPSKKFGADFCISYFCSELPTLLYYFIMEIKKDPKVNLETRKKIYWITGLTAILAILFISFEWTNVTHQKKFLGFNTTEILPDEVMIATVQNTPPPPPPPPPPMPDIIEDLQVVDNDIDVAELDIESSEADDATLVEIMSQTIDQGPVEEDYADENKLFVIVEDNPEFPGGNSALLQYLSKSIRYPAFEAENGIQGRVVLSFVVERDGSITDIEELRSPSPGLTKEAMRVVQSMPKWKPGKQRGKNVRVKFQLPVTFRLM